MAYNIEFNGEGFIVRFEGRVAGFEVVEANNVIQGSEHFDTHKYQIFDFADADGSAVKKTDALINAASDFGASQSNASVKVALILKKPRAVEIGGSYIEKSNVLGTPWDFAVFNSMEEALHWATT